MQIIAHRGYWLKEEEKNTVVAFRRAIDNCFGIETDVRDKGNQLVISHDMPSSNDLCLLEEILDLFAEVPSESQSLAINVKADGLCNPIKYLLADRGIQNYFAFDMSIPEMYRYGNSGLKFFTHCSDICPNPPFELAASGLWLDAFDRLWYKESDLRGLVSKYKLVCIVSDELHGRDHKQQWRMLKNIMSVNSNWMLCTDRPQEARDYFHD